MRKALLSLATGLSALTLLGAPASSSPTPLGGDPPCYCAPALFQLMRTCVQCPIEKITLVIAHRGDCERIGNACNNLSNVCGIRQRVKFSAAVACPGGSVIVSDEATCGTANGPLRLTPCPGGVGNVFTRVQCTQCGPIIMDVAGFGAPLPAAVGDGLAVQEHAFKWLYSDADLRTLSIERDAYEDEYARQSDAAFDAELASERVLVLEPDADGWLPAPRSPYAMIAYKPLEDGSHRVAELDPRMFPELLLLRAQATWLSQLIAEKR